MWNFSCLVFVMMVGLSFSEDQDSINSLLSKVNSKLNEPDRLQCQQTGFISETIGDLKLPTMDNLKEADFSESEAFRAELQFTFPYAGRETKNVTINRNGILLLKGEKGDVDYIAPIPQASSDEKLIVKYRNSTKYLLVKWSDLVVQNDTSNKSEYTFSIIIYDTGEILIAYGKINDQPGVSIQVVKYHKLKQALSYEYVGPSLYFNETVSDSFVYIKECTLIQDNPTPEKTPTLASPTEKISTTPKPEIETKENKLKLEANYKDNSARAKILFDKLSGEKLTQLVRNNGSERIPLNFTFNHVSYKTVIIEPEGKILLNVNENIVSHVQVEPIPITELISSNPFIQDVSFKQGWPDGDLTILFQNLEITTDNKSHSNEILVVFKKTGIIEIVYKNLLFKDISMGIVVLQTSSDVVAEGKVDFTQITNGTIVSFGDASIPAENLTKDIANNNEIVKNPKLSELLQYFGDPSVPNNNDTVHLLDRYYQTDVDVSSFTFQADIATINSEFSIGFNKKSFKNISITKSMELYFDNIHRKLQIVPAATEFSGIDFKYSNTTEFISLTWANLHASTDITYKLRVLIFSAGEILILFKEIKNDTQSSVYHSFITRTKPTEVQSGHIMKISVKDMEKIPLPAIKELKDDVIKNVTEFYAGSSIFTVLNVQLVEQFDIAMLDFDIIIWKNDPINFDFELCENINNVVVSNTMELFMNGNRTLKLVPGAINLEDTSYKLINETDFVAMIWDDLQIGIIKYDLRVFIFKDGNVFVLYKNVKPNPMSNELLKATKAISLATGKIITINICAIKPILFEDLLSEFKKTSADSSPNLDVALLDDVKLQTYLTLNPDTNETTESELKRYTIPSKFLFVYGPNSKKLSEINVGHSVQLFLKEDSVISLVPTTKNGETFNSKADFKFTTTLNYITMTWNNLTVTTNGGTATYKQIRAIIFQDGTILIIYDIDTPVDNVFFTEMEPKPIRLKHGLIVKTNVAILFDKSEILRPIDDILDLFVDTTIIAIHLNESEFNSYFTSGPDLSKAVCSDNVCKIESKFKIRYGESEVTSINIVSSTQLYFAENLALSLVHTDGFKTVENGQFNYSATIDYVSITWHNLMVNKNITYDMRVVIFPVGDVVVFYKFPKYVHESTVFQMLPPMERKIINRMVIKISVNDIFDYRRPNLLLDEIKGINKATDSCVTQLNDASKRIVEKLFAIKKDLNVLAEDQTEISMNFIIQTDGKIFKNIRFRDHTKFYFDMPTQFYDLSPFGKLTRDENNFKIHYMTTLEYTSVSLANVTFQTDTNSKITFDARALIYPTGDIILGYKSSTGVPLPSIVIHDTPIDLKNGTVILAQARLCKKTKMGIKKVSTHKVSPQEEAFTSSSKHIYVAQSISSLLSFNLILLSVTHFKL